MEPDRFYVGRWHREPGQLNRWVTYREFPTAKEAMRAARRLYESWLWRWVYNPETPLPDVSCVRIGGGTVFDLDHTIPHCVPRTFYRQVGEMMRWADREE